MLWPGHQQIGIGENGGYDEAARRAVPLTASPGGPTMIARHRMM
jgi:hypothetical protein